MKPILCLLSLLCAIPVLAKPPAPKAESPQAAAISVSTAPVTLPRMRRRGVGELREAFVSAIEDAPRRAALEELARTPPESLRDVSSLFDLYSRFSQSGAREAVMSSLDRLDERSAALEPAFVEYIKLKESDANIFGIRGALRLRAPRALPLIRKFAERRFEYRSPGESPVLSDKNAWWAHYEALAALAQWQGAQALPLLRKKAAEAPMVARLMALHAWKDSLPDIIKWSGGNRAAKERAHEALTAEVSVPALRQTRARMLAVLRDPKAERELRHQLSLKVGICSTPEEIDELLTEEAAAKNPETRLSLRAALFASRSPKTVPWLKSLSARDPDPKMRMGALLQLRLLLSPAELRPLLEETAAKDPDPDNRQSAESLLRSLEP
jgi:hypothetical protein